MKRRGSEDEPSMSRLKGCSGNRDRGRVAGAGTRRGAVASSAVKPTAAANPWTPPRTPWGEPDLQGMWDFQSTTPLNDPVS